MKKHPLKYQTFLKRVCIRCGKKYLPTGKFSKICEKCYIKRKKWSGSNIPYALRINDKGEITDGKDL